MHVTFNMNSLMTMKTQVRNVVI